MRFCGQCGARLPEEAPKRKREVELGALVGGDLKARLQMAGIEAAGQRRSVTVLFADLSGFTSIAHKLDSEDVYHLIQRYLKTLAEDVFNYEGIVDKFTGDGLMALFGAPIAHENDAERAVRAALDMQASVAQISQEFQLPGADCLQARIGLHAGTVIVGQVGDDRMLDYTAIGDTVNLASRLETAAEPGTILVSQPVYRQTQAAFDFEALPPLRLKGIPEPVRAYRVLSARYAGDRVRDVEGLQAPMIARDRELILLQDRIIDLAHRGQGQFVWIKGEAGIGKSRLSREFIAWLQKKQSLAVDPLVIEGQSLTYRKSISYWIFQILLRNYLGITQETSDAEAHAQIRAKLARLLGERTVQITPYIEHLLALEPSDPAAAERISFLTPDRLRSQIFLAVRDLIIAQASHRPLLIVLDDLHWADQTSLELLSFLLESIPAAPLYILCMSRAFQGGPLAAIFEKARRRFSDRFLSLELKSLSARQSDSLLEQLLAIPDFPEDVKSQIIERAAGVPFYLEEILRTLIEAGVIHRSADRWQVASGVRIDDLGVPDTLRGLILARFDRLDRVRRSVLQVAAVIGREFSLPVLAAALANHMADVQIRAALDSLVARNFIRQREGAVPREYIFSHVLTSDAIYSTMLKPARERLHSQVAETMERLYQDRLDSYVELLANHYLNGGQLDRALHFLILAGAKASRDYANEQARQHYEMALGLLARVPYSAEQALQIHAGLGDVLTLVGEFQAARRQYQSALDSTSSETGEHFLVHRSELNRKVAATFERQGDFDKALDRLEVARNLLEELEDPHAVSYASIINDSAWIRARRGQLDQGIADLEQALAHLESIPQVDLVASIYNRLGGIYFMKDDFEKASHFTRRSLLLREQIGDIRGVARSHNNLGILHYNLGNWETALEHYQNHTELQARIGDAEALAIGHMNIALVQLGLGDFDAAEANLSRSLQSSAEIGAPFHEAMALLYSGRMAVDRGRYEHAWDYLERSEQLFLELGSEEHLVDVFHLKGSTQLGMDNLSQARQWAQRSGELLSKLGSHSLERSEQNGRLYRLLGKIEAREGSYAGARQKLEASYRIFELRESLYERGLTRFQMAVLESERGNSSDAEKYLQEAEQIFSRLRARHDAEKIVQLRKQIVAKKA